MQILRKSKVRHIYLVQKVLLQGELSYYIKKLLEILYSNSFINYFMIDTFLNLPVLEPSFFLMSHSFWFAYLEFLQYYYYQLNVAF